MTTSPLDSLSSDFLRTHRLGVLATSRSNGAPQISLIAYHYDGNDIVISTGNQSAKYRNLSRRPTVSLLVSDGPKAVTVYGSTEIITGDDAVALREQRLEATRPAGAPVRTRPLPNRGERVIIRITPEKSFSNQLES